MLSAFVLLVTFAACGRNAGDPDRQEDASTTSNIVRVTFPEGYSVTQVAERLEKNGVCTAEEFLTAVNPENPGESAYGLVRELASAEHRAYLLEGYVFPDTYDFYRNEPVSSVIGRFLKNSERKLTDEIKTKAESLGFTVDEVLTIASIIQKEAGLKEQMTKVSSVIHNRLSASYNKLECDVTINYLEKYVIPYLDPESDTSRYNEYYNTYKCKGLPAGPICNPGIEAIEAAVNPEDTDYLFFVTDKEDPSIYYYAVTYEEHKANCKKAGW